LESSTDRDLCCEELSRAMIFRRMRELVRLFTHSRNDPKKTMKKELKTSIIISKSSATYVTEAQGRMKEWRKK
jgi:hypothetical protein